MEKFLPVAENVQYSNGDVVTEIKTAAGDPILQINWSQAIRAAAARFGIKSPSPLKVVK